MWAICTSDFCFSWEIFLALTNPLPNPLPTPPLPGAHTADLQVRCVSSKEPPPLPASLINNTAVTQTSDQTPFGDSNGLLADMCSCAAMKDARRGGLNLCPVLHATLTWFPMAAQWAVRKHVSCDTPCTLLPIAKRGQGLGKDLVVFLISTKGREGQGTGWRLGKVRSEQITSEEGMADFHC